MKRPGTVVVLVAVAVALVATPPAGAKRPAPSSDGRGVGRWFDRAAAPIGATLRWHSGARPALPPAVDADGDGFTDSIETILGSDPANAGSTPESLAVSRSCVDGIDNDLDSKTDLKDAGCVPPDVATVTFPPAGVDAFDSHMILDAYPFDTPFGICPVDFDGEGPSAVSRSAPSTVDGKQQIDAELFFQVEGPAMLLPGSPCNTGASPIPFDATILTDPDKPSKGTITEHTADPSTDFPADSFFDVFFLVDTPLGLLPGGPPGGPAGDSVKVENVIKSIPPYYSPGDPNANPKCYAVSGLAHQHCPLAPLDHFKCYKARFPAFASRKATLADQFGKRRTHIEQPTIFCNPVSKNGSKIFDENGHLKGYLLKSGQAFGKRTVIVVNQFGENELTVITPHRLFVPSQKNKLPPPLALDHFECYTATGPSVGKTVTLEDQFDVHDKRVERALVLKPVLLCNPAQKTVRHVVTKIGNPFAHLVCYRIKTGDFKPRQVTVRNQFGKEVGKVIRPIMLCVPSLKSLPQEIVTLTTTPVPTTGTVGDAIHDTAVVSGGTNPTGTVTFLLFPPQDQVCSGQPIFNDTEPLVQGQATSQDVVVNVPGTYRWVAVYNGDQQNQPAATGCDDEQVVIQPHP